MNNIRIDWIDLTKGIAIFLMVCGHTSIPLSISNWIWFSICLYFLSYQESYLMQQNIPTLTCL